MYRPVPCRGPMQLSLLICLIMACGGSPTQPVKLKFTTIAADSVHTCALATNGAAYCWGDNEAGELGDGGAEAVSTVPVPVSGHLTFSSVSAGSGDACGVTATGAAYCWGSDYFGQLGDGDTTYHLTPVAVSGGLKFSLISTGVYHTCGVSTAGVAYCWGGNDFGVLGHGDSSNRTMPVLVAGGLVFSTVSVRRFHACGVAGGAAYCWGLNQSGQLGDSLAELSSPVPVPVAGGHAFTTVSVGAAHSCGLTTSGIAYCWGSNGFGQLGIATASPPASTVPVAVAGGLTFNALSAGSYHTCGVTPSGAAYCWGQNRGGQLGDSTAADTTAPTPVAGALTFSTVGSGVYHTCGVTPDGAAYCWGLGDYGQLGQGFRRNSLIPVIVAN